jgi:phosphoribosylcarboxyaminoimidazole (NCAIR) mutase
MPGGVPVLTVGAGSGGAANAALGAARILALSDKHLAHMLCDYRDSLAKGVEEKDAAIASKMQKRKE